MRFDHSATTIHFFHGSLLGFDLTLIQLSGDHIGRRKYRLPPSFPMGLLPALSTPPSRARQCRSSHAVMDDEPVYLCLHRRNRSASGLYGLSHLLDDAHELFSLILDRFGIFSHQFHPVVQQQDLIFHCIDVLAHLVDFVQDALQLTTGPGGLGFAWRCCLCFDGPLNDRDSYNGRTSHVGQLSGGHFQQVFSVLPTKVSGRVSHYVNPILPRVEIPTIKIGVAALSEGNITLP